MSLQLVKLGIGNQGNPLNYPIAHDLVCLQQNAKQT